MPSESQVRFVRQSVLDLAETLYETGRFTRETYLEYKRTFRSRRVLREIATDLYGPRREASLLGHPNAKLVLMSLKEMGGRPFNLLVFKHENDVSPRRGTVRCFVGHRFTKAIEKRFRWNLRELFGVFGIEVEYSAFDGAAVNIIDEIRQMIRTYEFCLFDNRETTATSKPNVYIEAGMAFALNRPFIFCHHKREVWPSDFSNVNYIAYKNYKELFQKLYAVLPVFLERKVLRRRHRRR